MVFLYIPSYLPSKNLVITIKASIKKSYDSAFTGIQYPLPPIRDEAVAIASGTQNKLKIWNRKSLALPVMTLTTSVFFFVNYLPLHNFSNLLLSNSIAGMCQCSGLAVSSFSKMALTCSKSYEKRHCCQPSSFGFDIAASATRPSIAPANQEDCSRIVKALYVLPDTLPR